MTRRAFIPAPPEPIVGKLGTWKTSGDEIVRQLVLIEDWVLHLGWIHAKVDLKAVVGALEAEPDAATTPDRLIEAADYRLSNTFESAAAGKVRIWRRGGNEIVLTGTYARFGPSQDGAQPFLSLNTESLVSPMAQTAAASVLGHDWPKRFVSVILAVLPAIENRPDVAQRIAEAANRAPGEVAPPEQPFISAPEIDDSEAELQEAPGLDP